MEKTLHLHTNKLYHKIAVLAKNCDIFYEKSQILVQSVQEQKQMLSKLLKNHCEYDKLNAIKSRRLSWCDMRRQKRNRFCDLSFEVLLAVCCIDSRRNMLLQVFLIMA